MPTYTYGMKGAPRVGNGLGGLPKKSANSFAILPTVIYFDSGSGDFKVPSGFRSIRIVAVGPGGTGGTTAGAGGGGLSATSVIGVVEGEIVSYSVGASGTDTTAKFRGYTLVGGSGASPGSSPTGGAGGIGSGGDSNYNGGKGGDFSTYKGGGGGAAGLGSNGGGGGSGNNVAGATPGISTGELAAGGGGASANTTANPVFSGSGGGTGGAGSGSLAGAAVFSYGGYVKPFRGSIGFSAYIDPNLGTMPGFPGGGGGASSITGANGCVRIELWP